MKTLALALTTLLAVWMAPSRSDASCLPPPAELLWSYPADGAVDVPTNATLWIVERGWTGFAGTLNGVPLEGKDRTFAAVSFQPTLEPDTDYTLAFDTLGEMPEHYEITFRTGRAEANAPAEPAVTGAAFESPDTGTGGCPAVVDAQDCFDSGQDTLLSFEVDAAAAGDIATLVVPENGYAGASTVWPADCGDPTLMVYGGNPGGGQPGSCFLLYAIGDGGLQGEATQHCPVPPASGSGGAGGDAGSPAQPHSNGSTPDGSSDDSPPADSGGCSASSTAASEHPVVWSALLLVVAGWRHRARKRRAGSAHTQRSRSLGAEVRCAKGR